MFIVFSFFIKKEQFELLEKLKPSFVLISIAIQLILYAISGTQYYYVRKFYDVTLEKKDLFLFPLATSFWGFLIPFQGGLLFSTLFFKLKYKMRLTESFSINIYIYLVTIFFAGITGLIFSVANHLSFSLFFIISVLLILNPFLIYVVHAILVKIPYHKWGIFSRLFEITHFVVTHTKTLWQNWRRLKAVFLLEILHIIVFGVLFYWISYALGYHYTFLTAIILSFIQEMLLVVKFTPNNLGVSQLVSGAFFKYLGQSPSDAVMITLFLSLTSLMIIFSFGVVANIYYIRYFRLQDISLFQMIFNRPRQKVI
jgi:uncharacterized membrane protein YbhN (UPF0104 family)